MLNKDLFCMVKDAAVHKRMIVKTFSNGMMLERYIEPIVQSSLDGIVVFINGHDPEDFHRLTRTVGLFCPKTYKNIKRLVEVR
ncbi:hypothetical protein MYX64_00800 [Nitrospinae bacterium AH_259_B05_G02_I21]|nr:hypothetical protein [Nitrospinae bacterium AH_259_B05_G02_I21]MDA2931916.1 hypothetical protein [Nitrospinae bacterium AH-259-F20]